VLVLLCFSSTNINFFLLSKNYFEMQAIIRLMKVLDIKNFNKKKSSQKRKQNLKNFYCVETNRYTKFLCSHNIIFYYALKVFHFFISLLNVLNLLTSVLIPLVKKLMLHECQKNLDKIAKLRIEIILYISKS